MQPSASSPYALVTASALGREWPGSSPCCCGGGLPQCSDVGSPSVKGQGMHSLNTGFPEPPSHLPSPSLGMMQAAEGLLYYQLFSRPSDPHPALNHHP